MLASAGQLAALRDSGKLCTTMDGVGWVPEPVFSPVIVSPRLRDLRQLRYVRCSIGPAIMSNPAKPIIGGPPLLSALALEYLSYASFGANCHA